MKPIFPHDRSPICSEVSVFAGMKQGFGSHDLSVTTPSIGSQTFMRLPWDRSRHPRRSQPRLTVETGHARLAKHPNIAALSTCHQDSPAPAPGTRMAISVRYYAGQTHEGL